MSTPDLDGGLCSWGQGGGREGGDSDAFLLDLFSVDSLFRVNEK